MNEENPYATTRAPLADPAGQDDSRPSIGARFLWTAGIAFPVFTSFALFAPQPDWSMLTLGAAMMSVITGLIAMCIPVRHKAAFIVPSIIAGLVLLFAIGAYLE